MEILPMAALWWVVAIAAHELGHCLFGKLAGAKQVRFSINYGIFLGVRAEYGLTNFQMLLFALGGPLFSLFLWFFAKAAVPVSLYADQLARMVVISLAVEMLLPIPIMDGPKIIYFAYRCIRYGRGNRVHCAS